MASSMSTSTRIDASGPLLLQLWLSPAFPVGGYSYSHGLEYAVETGLVKTRHDLERWIGGVLAFGTGRNDAILLRESHGAVATRAFTRFVELAAFAAALKGTAELALEAEAQGAAFQKALAAGWPMLVLREPFLALAQAGIPASYVIAFAAAAALAGIEMRFALLSYLQAFVGNLVSAALRLMPLGQSDGVATLATVTARLPDLVATIETTPFDDIGSAALAVDLCSARHETQYTRLFRS
jgi:urease accessory protein